MTEWVDFNRNHKTNMVYLIVIASIVFVSILFLIYTRQLDLAKTVVNLVGLLGLFIAFLKYQSDKEKEQKDLRATKEKVILDQCILSLSWAYESLSKDQPDENKPPHDNRLNWVTASRHIKRYWDLKKSIGPGVHRIICNEHEEYWRSKFFKRLNNDSLQISYYFLKLPIRDAPQNIDLGSAVVLNEFVGCGSDESATEGGNYIAEKIESGKAFESGPLAKPLKEYYRAIEAREAWYKAATEE